MIYHKEIMDTVVAYIILKPHYDYDYSRDMRTYFVNVMYPSEWCSNIECENCKPSKPDPTDALALLTHSVVNHPPRNNAAFTQVKVSISPLCMSVI